MLSYIVIHVSTFIFGLWFMVFNATFNNIWFISWRQLYWREYPVKTTDLSQVTDKTLSHNVVSSTSRHQRGSNSQYLFLLTINCLLTRLMNRWNLSWFFYISFHICVCTEIVCVCSVRCSILFAYLFGYTYLLITNPCCDL